MDVHVHENAKKKGKPKLALGAKPVRADGAGLQC